jgi:hypothetical protein
MQVECVLKKLSHYNWPSLEGDGQPKQSSSSSSSSSTAAAAAAAPIAAAGNVKTVTHEQHSAASSSTAALLPAAVAAAAPAQGLAKPYSSNRNWNAIDREITKELEVSHTCTTHTYFLISTLYLKSFITVSLHNA